MRKVTTANPFDRAFRELGMVPKDAPKIVNWEPVEADEEKEWKAWERDRNLGEILDRNHNLKHCQKKTSNSKGRRARITQMSEISKGITPAQLKEERKLRFVEKLHRRV